MSDRGSRGGKRSEELKNRGIGYYENEQAGNKRYFEGAQWGTQREFVGSQTEEYTFKDPIHGTHTITAESKEDALRIAKAMGYKENDYQPRKRNRGRKKR